MSETKSFLSIPGKEKVLTELIKAGGVALVLGAVNWFLWQQNLSYQERNEKRILQLEKDIKECSSATVELLKDQIQKNNTLLEKVNFKMNEQ